MSEPTPVPRVNADEANSWQRERTLLIAKLDEERKYSSDLTRRLQKTVKESERRKHEATKAAQKAADTIQACNDKIQRLLDQRDLERSHFKMQLTGAMKGTGEPVETKSTECQTPRRFMPNYQPKSKNTKRRTKASTLPSSNDLWPAKSARSKNAPPVNPWGEPVQSPSQRRTYPPASPYSKAFELDPRAPAFALGSSDATPSMPGNTRKNDIAQINNDIVNQVSKSLLMLNTQWRHRLDRAKQQTEHHKQREQALRRTMQGADGWVPPKAL